MFCSRSPGTLLMAVRALSKHEKKSALHTFAGSISKLTAKMLQQGATKMCETGADHIAKCITPPW